ncbi:MAG: hypothetical protein DDT26_00298 [Dehalococcoidia bacterium]|nr:hypothetical protein [Chloroflexota bacterium]
MLTTAPKTNTKEWRLYAVDNSGVIEIEAILNTYKQHSYNVETLVALQGNTIKADDLYGAFVRSGRILVGTSQSFGGRAVWSKLSAQKGVVVFGWDSKTQTPINLGPRYKMDNPEIHVDPSDYDAMASMREKGAGDTAINPYYQEYKHLAAAHIVASPRDSKIKIHPPGK